jgi:hypothetical protein
MKDQIEIGLRELKASITRIKELLEWKKLRKQEERSDVPPSFRLRDDTETEIKTEEGFFWWTAVNIKTVLVSRAGPIAERQRERLAKLEGEVWKLATKE